MTIDIDKQILKMSAVSLDMATGSDVDALRRKVQRMEKKIQRMQKAQAWKKAKKR